MSDWQEIPEISEVIEKAESASQKADELSEKLTADKAELNTEIDNAKIKSENDLTVHNADETAHPDLRDIISALQTLEAADKAELLEAINSKSGGGVGEKGTGTWSEKHNRGSEASGECSFVEGNGTRATDYCAHAAGNNTFATNYSSFVIGKINANMTNGGDQYTQIGDVFVIGNGTNRTMSRTSNAFRVDYQGNTYGTGAFNSSGADYAEFIKEWADGNPESEDRVGYFVTAYRDGLIKANENDFILGITSGNPSIVGNADEDYYWKYERDAFNRIVLEDVPEIVEEIDDDGNVTERETGNIIKNARMKLRDNYDNSLQTSYVPRKKRKEWDYVGMLGMIPVRDDGTCEAGGFCKCSNGGIATRAEQGFAGQKFYVVERINENVVSVVVK